MAAWWQNLSYNFAAWYYRFSAQFYQAFIVEDRWRMITSGLWVTIRVAVIAIILGIILGIIIAVMRMVRIDFFSKIPSLKFLDKLINWIFKWFSYIYLDIFRGIPLVPQLMVWHFVIFANTNVPPMVGAMIAFGVNSGAMVAEIIRAGIMSVDTGQTEAGRSLGLTPIKTMGFIILPQAVKNILPTVANEFISLIRETSILGFVAVTDLQRAADQIRSLTFIAWHPLFAAAIIYYIIIKILTIFLRKLERNLRKADLR